MNRILLNVLLLGNLIFCFGQEAPKPYGVLPTDRQLKWQETEMYCIVHLSVATYTDKEWGYGDEDAKIFNPSRFSALKIAAAAKAGGFKGLVIVAKHHDGFCLWPTKTTEHNISKSPYKNDKGDIVKEYQLACKKLGMKMGIYCSPWDRNNALYGKDEYVTKVYREQLKELYAGYGDLFMSWHDGANGGNGYYGGSKDLRKIDQTTYYCWPENWAIARDMQPGAAIFGDVGPDVRWVGNEEGQAGVTSWATYTPESLYPGQEPSSGNIKYWLATEGTRNGKLWMPAECDVPIRPGWFYHSGQDGQTKSVYTLMDIYYKSVGRGAALDLGLSPNKQGMLSKEDTDILKEFGLILKNTFSVNLANGARLQASNVRGGNNKKFGPALLLDKDRYSYWASDDTVTDPSLIMELNGMKTFNVIRLKENIKIGQRIELFAVDAFHDGNWMEIARGTSIGANSLIRLPENITSARVRLRILKSPVSIAISDFGLFKEPTHLTGPKIDRLKNGYVIISTTAPVESIYYTLDGKTPDEHSMRYSTPFNLPQGGMVKAIAIDGKQKSGLVLKEFGLSKSNWKVISDIDHGKTGDSIDELEVTFLNTATSDSLKVFHPTGIMIDLGKIYSISGFSYLPRQDKKTEGIVKDYEAFVSDDGKNWNRIGKGEFANINSNPIEQKIALSKKVQARYFRFNALSVFSGNGISIAELGIFIL